VYRTEVRCLKPLSHLSLACAALFPGSEAVVQSVAGDKFAIGYSAIGYKTEGVRAVRSLRITAAPATTLPLR
jgi:ABC-type phosphate transport system substrate-binding protein